MKPQSFVFIGRSGCGKGTQAALLKEALQTKGINNIYHLETGARFREFIGGTSHSSKLSKEVMTEGTRQPDFLAVWVWSHLMVENMKGGETLIIDGAPRSLLEAKALTSAFDFYQIGDRHVIYLDISREEALRRLTERGRGDDKSLSNITVRLNWFDDEVLPAIEYFKQAAWPNKFIQIDGEQSIEAIHAELLAKIG